MTLDRDQLKRMEQVVKAVLTKMAGLTLLTLAFLNAAQGLSPDTNIQAAQSGSGDSAAKVDGAAMLNNQVQSCLDNVSRDCALTVALRVTAAGDLSIERAKVLFAIADTFRHLGDNERAALTTSLAKEEADSIGISVGTEQSYVQVARLQAELGNVADAQATVEAIGDRFLKAHAAGHAAVGLSRKGRYDEAVGMLNSINLPLIALNYTLQVIDAVGSGGDPASVDALDQLVGRLVDPETHGLMRFIADARIGGSRAQTGDRDSAMAIRDELVDRARSFTAFNERARAFVALGRLTTILEGADAPNNYLDRAQSLTARVTVPYDRDITLRELVIALAEANRFDAAVRAMNRFASVQAKAETLDALARFVGRTKNGEGVRIIQSVVSQGLEDLVDEDSRIARDQVRVDLVAALTHVGAINQAVRTISAIEDDEEQARALAFLARAL